MNKPKRYTSYYYDYMQEVRPWLRDELPRADRACIEKELWDAIQEAVEGASDATVYLDFEVLESYLEAGVVGPCVDRIMALLKQLADENDPEGIYVEISW
jgi:hypothetical protein